jgi:hypothetical protein
MTEFPATLAISELIDQGLSQGVQQVEAAGSPLHPFLIDETGQIMLLYDESGAVDPMQLALAAIKSNVPGIRRCVLVIDSRIAVDGDRKADAILVMSCERDVEFGEIWAQRYVPKGLFRKFRLEGNREKIGNAKNFIAAALEDA